MSMGGYSIGLTAEFGTIRQPLSIDVTYGDAITPSPEFRDFTGMIDNRLHMQLLSYTVETVMSEKIQSILKRGVATTRPRDFYDLHMLHIRGEYVRDVLALALQNTIVNRSSERSGEASSPPFLPLISRSGNGMDTKGKCPMPETFPLML